MKTRLCMLLVASHLAGCSTFSTPTWRHAEIPPPERPADEAPWLKRDESKLLQAVLTVGTFALLARHTRGSDQVVLSTQSSCGTFCKGGAQ